MLQRDSGGGASLLSLGGTAAKNWKPGELLDNIPPFADGLLWMKNNIGIAAVISFQNHPLIV